MSDTLEVAIAAGGTAGHINPALALAEELRDRGHHVTFYGQPTRLEATLVPKAGFDFFQVHVSGFDRSRPWTLVSALARMAKANRAIAAHFAETRTPDVAIGFGAYVEMALLDCCRKHGVPLLVHEQNSVPGLANKTQAKHAARVCISVPAARKVFSGIRGGDDGIVLTGNPVRRSVLEADGARGRASLGVPADATMLLVFGGSLGAKTLNQGLAALKDRLLGIDGLYVVHSTGKGGYDDAVSALALSDEEAKRWKVMPYIDDMGDVLAASDLIVSRAGASSIAEIAALGVPSLLVPYPFATADHQTTNARYLVDAGAAVLLTDDEVPTDAFAHELLELLQVPARRDAMREAARGLGQDRAAAKLADELEAVAAGR